MQKPHGRHLTQASQWRASQAMIDFAGSSSFVSPATVHFYPSLQFALKYVSECLGQGALEAQT